MRVTVSTGFVGSVAAREPTYTARVYHSDAVPMIGSFISSVKARESVHNHEEAIHVA